MIPINELYTYHQLEQITHSSGHREYITPEGHRVPSVTTILSETGDKSGLIEWRLRVGNDEANRISKEAASLGSLMHTHLEQHIMGLERPAGNNIIRVMARDMADTIIQRGMTSITEVWGMEKRLYFPELYAGTADLIGMYQNAPAIMDYKTSRKIKKEEYIEDYFHQICAYSLAHNELYNTKIKHGVIFMVSRDCQFKCFLLEGLQFQNKVDGWYRRVDEWYSRNSK